MALGQSFITTRTCFCAVILVSWGGCYLCSLVVNFFLNTQRFPVPFVVLPFSLCFQNLRVKNYSDGDWISEDDLAKGINAKC